MKGEAHDVRDLDILASTQRCAVELLNHNQRMIAVAAAVHRSLAHMAGDPSPEREIPSELDEPWGLEAARAEQHRQVRRELERLQAVLGRTFEEQQTLLAQMARIELVNRTLSSPRDRARRDSPDVADLCLASDRLQGTLDCAQAMATIQGILVDLGIELLATTKSQVSELGAS